ncbi:MAG: GGDEF domain-containing protein [Planctomycetota bacterium]
MSTRNRSTRAARGRVVVVGAATASDELPQAVVHADNLFDAVGEVTVSSSAEPVSAVVVPAPLVRGSARMAAEAFRRIDPSVRLILLVSSPDEPDARDGLADGFDEVVASPLSAAVVSRIVGGGEQPPAAAEPGPQLEPAPLLEPPTVPDPAPPPRPGGPPEISEHGRPRPGGPPEKSEHGRPRPGGPPEISEHGRSQPVEAPDAPVGHGVETIISPGMSDLIDAMEPGVPDADAEPQGSLGDTDLVEAILTDPAGLRALALRLMIEQTHWSDLALTDRPPPGYSTASAEVRFGKRCFGALSSRQARERQLRPWAAWLARWLALDHGYREYRTLAFQDELTGAGNRRFYEVFMKKIIRHAARQRRTLTVLVFDIDDFKRYNDEFGHDAGDEVLRETVRLLNSVIRAGDRVCRIGGDEFVVIFADPEGPREPDSNPPETVEEIAGRFQDQICQMKFPKLGLDAPGTLSISGGLATYPWDGADPESLLRHADQLALQSKQKGKNVITLGPGAQRLSRGT